MAETRIIDTVRAVDQAISNQADILIAGAGPVGLMLAAELRIGGASVIVLERLMKQSQAIKAGAINGRSLQALTRRGLRDQLEKEANKYNKGFEQFTKRYSEEKSEMRPVGKFDGQFGGLILRASSQLSIPPGLVLPQQALELLLKARATQLGVAILEGHAITTFTDQPDGVTVTTKRNDEEITFHGKFLIGCDGGRSTVRKLAKFDFPGNDPLTTGRQAIVQMTDAEKLPVGWNVTDNGLYVHAHPGRILTLEFTGPPADRNAEMTVHELQESLFRVSGIRVTISTIESWTRFTDNTRQASTYRKGHILLAGDAAHVHPPFGGQGLNLGLQDAVNLGWKLAAVVRGDAPADLLDSYTSERHPVGEQVVENTRAQIALMRPDVHSRSMRKLVEKMIPISEVTDQLVSLLQGLDIHYDFGSATNNWAGKHMPDIAGTEEAMFSGKGVLFGFPGSGDLRSLVEPWSDRVLLYKLPANTELKSMLVRPDGYVAWATDKSITTTDSVTLQQALLKWWGRPLTD